MGDMAFGVCNHTLTAINGNTAILIGASNYATKWYRIEFSRNVLEITAKWSDLGICSEIRRRGHCVSCMQNHLVISGGGNRIIEEFFQKECFIENDNINCDRIERLKQYSTIKMRTSPRLAYHASTVLNQEYLLLSGGTCLRPNLKVYLYHLSTGTWYQVKNNKRLTFGHSCTRFENYLIWFGGKNNNFTYWCEL